MLPTIGYAAKSANGQLAPYRFHRRSLLETDVLIDIKYCGVCHSDLHMVRNEWGGTIYPIVPGHEIVGVVKNVGQNVTKFKAGDVAGVGCFVDSCRHCNSCQEGEEQYCENGFVGTYNGIDKNQKNITFGGYSSQIVVDEKYTLKVPSNLPMQNVAPLLCAGITTYSPLKHWQTQRGDRVAVIGLGGLGHMAVKLAHSLGAEVTLLSTSKAKEADAYRLGAKYFAATSDERTLIKYKNYFKLIIDTVSAQHDYGRYLELLSRNGTMVLLGIPPEANSIHSFNLIRGRKRLAGSLVGGINETQEMLDYCAKHNILSDVEVIPIQQVNAAYERMLKGDVKYRFVIDMKSLSI